MCFHQLTSLILVVPTVSLYLGREILICFNVYYLYILVLMAFFVEDGELHIGVGGEVLGVVDEVVLVGEKGLLMGVHYII